MGQYGKEIYRSAKLTEDLNTASLGVIDQLRLLFSKFSNDQTAELDAEELVNEDVARKSAALATFIDKVTNKMNDLRQDSAVVQLSTEFMQCFDDVTDPERGKGRFYNFEFIGERNVTNDFVLLRITTKGR